MENTRPQPCDQTDVQDVFHLEAVRDDAGRKALFALMCREGLTDCAMYAWSHPREDDWLRLVSAPRRLLAGPARRLCGRHPAALHAGNAGAHHKDVSIRPQGPSVNNLHP